MAISVAFLASFAHLRRKLHNQRLVEQKCLPQRHDSRTTNRKFNWQISSDSPALAVISYLACRVVGNNASRKPEHQLNHFITSVVVDFCTIQSKVTH